MNQNLPIIGVMPLVDEEKDSLWMLPGYLDAIFETGGIPVVFPLTSDPNIISKLMDGVQGILLTGGQDVNPVLYGESVINDTVSFCNERDSMEKTVFKNALEKDLPVLGICRGIQFINAFLGGSLYQDIPCQKPSSVNHHQSPPYDKPVHKVSVSEESSLYNLIKKNSLSVNSYHHQAVKEPADTLKVMAVSEDGIIEAVEMPEKRFVWGVQWHPEFSHKVDEDSKKIFKEFVYQCKRYKTNGRRSILI